jgi:hypothetical protein
MLDGIRIFELTKIFGEGGFHEFPRRGRREIIGNEWTAKVNLSQIYLGIVIAWQRHLRVKTNNHKVDRERTIKLGEEMSEGEI